MAWFLALVWWLTLLLSIRSVPLVVPWKMRRFYYRRSRLRSQDSTSLNLPIPDYSQFLKTDLKGLKIGVIKETFGEGLDQVVAEAVNQALEQLKTLGATIKEISCPRFRYGLPTYYIIAPSEASANLARYDGVKYGIREDADSLIDMYTKTRARVLVRKLSAGLCWEPIPFSAGYYDAYYLKAQKVRTL
jgi:aspartyl-tRNA(Asn)/glutamyl-tRNA(Gln) amidotransferase subunit A